MNREKALQRLAEHYRVFDKKATHSFGEMDGTEYVVNATKRYSMAEQYKKLANLKTTDEAVAEIRNRTK